MKQFHKQYKNQIKQLADRMRNGEMPSLTEKLFSLFETTGSRLEYENVYFTRRKFLAVYGMAAYLFGRPDDVEKLEAVLREICAEECWALPAHVNRRENPDWRNSVDLFASETAQALAEIVALTEELSAELRAKVREEIERRVLVPFEQNHQGWECSDHNWNAVCGGSIGSAAIYLLAGREEERLEKILQRICHSLTFYLEGFREDGACMEGIGYFTYGMTYFTGFAEQLLRHSKGQINLFHNDKVQKIAEFQQKMYFSGGQTVSFSDGDTKAKFRMGLTAFLAKLYDTVQIPEERFACDFESDPCYRFMGLLRDYEWTKTMEAETSGEAAGGCMATDDAEQPKASARHDILPHAQWSICESKTKIGFAIKGGHNGEPHNHNDVGSFLYMVNGEQLLCDLGAGEYTADYFGPERYGILCNSSEGHNVPVVGGAFQKAGSSYKASDFSSDGRGKTTIEFSGAYAEGNIEKLTREAVFSLEDGSLSIKDSFVLPAEANGKNNLCGTSAYFTENLVTKGNVSLQDNAAIIRGKSASCLVKIEGDVKNLRVIEKEHFNHEGGRELIRLIQWDTVPEQSTFLLGEKGENIDGVSKYFIRCE